jgi:hypothetical protein
LLVNANVKSLGVLDILRNIVEEGREAVLTGIAVAVQTVELGVGVATVQSARGLFCG